MQALPDGRLRIGVHIAAPALAIGKGDAIDAVARERMSTVYMPGGKITMLPEEAIRPFSLDEGTERPALSLYVDLDAGGTAIERCILAGGADPRRGEPAPRRARRRVHRGGAAATRRRRCRFGEQLRALWKLTLALAAGREQVRGKPEPRGRADFSFYVDGERVRIVQRRRMRRWTGSSPRWRSSPTASGAGCSPSTGCRASTVRSRWAGCKMGTHALPHQGLGVAQYAWSTSPLRRYVDLVNQRQLVAVLRGDKPAFASNDSDLFSIISAFDAKYAAYGDFQTSLERYWCLRWLVQEGITRAPAVVVRDDLVRLADAPFYFRARGSPPRWPPDDGSSSTSCRPTRWS